MPDADQRQKGSLVRENEFLEVPLNIRYVKSQIYDAQQKNTMSKPHRKHKAEKLSHPRRDLPAGSNRSFCFPLPVFQLTNLRYPHR